MNELLLNAVTLLESGWKPLLHLNASLSFIIGRSWLRTYLRFRKNDRTSCKSGFQLLSDFADRA